MKNPENSIKIKKWVANERDIDYKEISYFNT